MKHEFNLGEFPIDNAPHIQLSDGTNCVPQHYLTYDHSRASVEALISRIEYNERYLIFVCEQKGEIYLQVGIIGIDNYKPAELQNGNKIVYGRRWRVEANLPSSEIIQTAFLALKKAREHEVRELVSLTQDGLKTTPFSNHHDLPLMAKHPAQLLAPRGEGDTASESLALLRFDHGKFCLQEHIALTHGQHVLTLSYHPHTRKSAQGILPETFSIVVNDLRPNTLYHGVMDMILNQSDLHVDTHFKFDGFARFNREVDIEAIAQLSATTRQRPKKAQFLEQFEASNYDTDSTRVPVIYEGAYGERLQLALEKNDVRNGIIPSSTREIA